MLAFFNENNEGINSLLGEKAKIEKAIFEKIKNIQEYFVDHNFDKEINFWIYQKNCLVADVKYNGYETAINVFFGFDKIYINLFVRNSSRGPSKNNKDLRGLDFEVYKNRIKNIGEYNTSFD